MLDSLRAIRSFVRLIQFWIVTLPFRLSASNCSTFPAADHFASPPEI